ncbi:MAG TPA: ATP-binding cassette domain-containing protein [Polyangia bacterium]|nr:ATP-binding cassette domain-containing protein [Polyangia bacterium]
MATLEVERVVKRFGDHVAVDGISFAIEPGKVLALVGPNGAGKSTTIRMILGILLPDQGSIRSDGEDMATVPKSAVGYLPEQRGMYLDLKPMQMLELIGGLRGLSRDAVQRFTRPWLQRLDLERHLNKKLGRLSKGLQQKVQLLMTFMHQPRLLILDEPLSGLDPVNVALFSEILTELKESGTAVLYSSHNMDQVERVADQVAIVDGGRIRRQGRIGDLLRESGRFVCRVDYFAEPVLPFSSDARGTGGWVMTRRGRSVVVETAGESELQEAARCALLWGPVQRLTLGQMTLQELYLETVDGPHTATASARTGA